MAHSDPNDPRYEYLEFENKVLTYRRLDELADFVINGTAASTWSQIAAGLKLIAVVSYVIAREKLVKAAAIVEKHKYEQSQNEQNQDEANQDSGLDR